MKYIDVETLNEKITEQMKSLPREVGRGAGNLTSKGHGMMEAFQTMCSIIDSLQQEQPEVNLPKEIDKYCETIHAWQVQEAPFTSLENCARHFYELGLKARKEKN